MSSTHREFIYGSAAPERSISARTVGVELSDLRGTPPYERYEARNRECCCFRVVREALLAGMGVGRVSSLDLARARPIPAWILRLRNRPVRPRSRPLIRKMAVSQSRVTMWSRLVKRIGHDGRIAENAKRLLMVWIRSIKDRRQFFLVAQREGISREFP